MADGNEEDYCAQGIYCDVEWIQVGDRTDAIGCTGLPVVSAVFIPARLTVYTGKSFVENRLAVWNMSQNYAYYAEILQKHLPELQKQFSVKSLGLFGSYVRGQQRAHSDLDILVNFDELPSLIKFIRLEDRLSELTGLEIDLVMEDGLKPNIGKRVLKEVVRI